MQRFDTTILQDAPLGGSFLILRADDRAAGTRLVVSVRPSIGLSVRVGGEHVFLNGKFSCFCLYF